MRIRIAQCLCSSARHAICGLGIDDDALTNEAVEAKLRETVAELLEGPLQPWCGLCGSPASAWQYEVRWSRDYPTREAAFAHLHQLEESNLWTRTRLDEAKRGIN